jgi:AraC-like DNA-binding protein
MTIVYLEGRGEVVFDESRLPFRVGTIVCVPPETPYAETSVDGFRSLFMASTELFPRAAGVQVFQERSTRPFHRLAAVLLEERQSGRRSRVAEQALFEALLVYLQELPQPTARTTGAAERLRALLLANLENPGFEIREAMAALPWSATHLRKTFARAAGMTPQAFLAQARVEKAKRLLRIGGFSIKQIAHAVGIADPHYFSRMFHRLAGCRPGDYRRGHAG